MSRFILYATSGCHLCEQAQQIIQSVADISVTEVDIADNDALLARYAMRIPVLKCLATGTELGWPFGADDVRAWQQQNDLIKG